MRSVSHKDYEKLLEAVGAIYSCLDSEALPSRIVSVVPGLVHSESVLFTDINMATLKLESVYDSTGTKGLFEKYEKNSPFIWKYMYEHPYANLYYHMEENPVMERTERLINKRYPDYARSPACKAVMLSDVLTAAEWRKTTVYNEYFRHLGVGYQLSTVLLLENERLRTLAFHRESKDFSERERAFLNLIGPHIIRHFRNLEEFDALKRSRNGALDGLTIKSIEPLRLTPSEAEVLYLLMQGKTNPEIAAITGRSPLTVKKHLQRVYQKLGVENRVAAMRHAMEKARY